MACLHRRRGRDKTVLSRRLGGVNKPLIILTWCIDIFCVEIACFKVSLAVQCFKYHELGDFKGVGLFEAKF